MPRAEQRRIVLPDGLIIERLPVGRANERWHLSFVCSGVDFLQGDPPRAVRFPDEFRSRVSVAAVAGDLQYLGGGAGGSDDEQEVRMYFADNGVTAIEVTYLDAGTPVAT
jgi:hypothetical protein